MSKNVRLMKGDNIASLKKLEDNSIDSIVTDPPYGISFMSKKWDYDVPSTEFWKEALRVLKPGGHVLSFSGTRTYHRMVVAMEDAGFEIRDQIQWIYGSGFPKSHNIGKSVDKIQGNDREVVGTMDATDITGGNMHPGRKQDPKTLDITKGQSEWEGWGTALKPANEPICLARKPFKGTIADNVLEWRTGGMNIDGCRIGIVGEDDRSAGIRTANFGEQEYTPGGNGTEPYVPNPEGRWPANVILDEEAGMIMDDQSGNRKSSGAVVGKDYTDGGNTYEFAGARSGESTNRYAGENGGASRFFYQAKVGKRERNLGLDGFEEKMMEGRDPGQDDRNVSFKPRPVARKNTHPTLKPVKLMAYLCRLITPPGGTILDPFMGSGSTGIAAMLEGFSFVGMEMDEEYIKIAKARIVAYEKYRQFL